MRFRFFIKDIPFLKFVKGMPLFLVDYCKIRRQARDAGNIFPFETLHPFFEDNSGSGSATGHYFHQDLLVAAKIFRNNTARHVDIGSRVDGFVAHVASFREIEVVDIREFGNHVQNILIYAG